MMIHSFFSKQNDKKSKSSSKILNSENNEDEFDINDGISWIDNIKNPATIYQRENIPKALKGSQKRKSYSTSAMSVREDSQVRSDLVLRLR